MKSLTDFRKKLFLTQEEMADYLGISRVQLAMAESARRYLPPGCLTKLAHLENNYISTLKSKPGSSIFPKSEFKIHTDHHLRLIKKRSYDCRYKITKLEKELKQVQETHKQATIWMCTITGIMSGLSKNKEGQPDHAWLKKRKESVSKKWLEASPVAQAILHAKIDLLKAEVIINNKLEKKLG